MSQSKSVYWVQNPKANGKRQRQPTNAAGDSSRSNSEPEPACRSRCVPDREWVEIPYTAALTNSYTPCGWDECYPAGAPDPDETETVIRSRRYPTVFHRVKPDGPAVHESTAEPTNVHPFAGANPAGERESIESITELRAGDGVTWDCLETPVVVIEQSETSGVLVSGPSGGEYQLHTRYGGAVVAYPGYGRVSGLARIVPDNHPQPEAV